MARNLDNETNQLEDKYYDQDEDEDDLGDFIVYSDEDEEPVKHKHLRQEELEDDIEEEVEEEVEPEEEEVEEEEVEEEEEEVVPVGQQEILSLREQLKEEIRRKNAAMATGTFKASCSSSLNPRMMPPVKDGYGTFFGPSKPVLARRVIEEGCSSFMKEQQNVPSRKGGQLVSKAQPDAIKNLQKPKLVSEETRKVDALRENRDYSSLFSDDADTQLTKEQPLVSKTESHVCGLVNSASMSGAPTGHPDHGKIAASASIQARVHSKSGSLGEGPLAKRKRMIAAGRNRSNLPNVKKTPGLHSSSNSQKLQPSVQSKRQQTLVPGQKQQQQPVSQGQRKQQQSQRLLGNGRQQSLQGRRPDLSVQGQRRLQSTQQQLGPSSKLKSSRPMEKRKVKRKSHDEREKVLSLVNEIMNYDPEKFIGRDEDDPNMEVGFASIEKEERRSAALARKEDEEQFRLIQEEEKRERAMKRKKAAHKE